MKREWSTRISCEERNIDRLRLWVKHAFCKWNSGAGGEKAAEGKSVSRIWGIYSGKWLRVSYGTHRYRWREEDSGGRYYGIWCINPWWFLPGNICFLCEKFPLSLSLLCVLLPPHFCYIMILSASIDYVMCLKWSLLDRVLLDREILWDGGWIHWEFYWTNILFWLHI